MKEQSSFIHFYPQLTAVLICTATVQKSTEDARVYAHKRENNSSLTGVKSCFSWVFFSQQEKKKKKHVLHKTTEHISVQSLDTVS